RHAGRRTDRRAARRSGQRPRRPHRFPASPSWRKIDPEAPPGKARCSGGSFLGLDRKEGYAEPVLANPTPRLVRRAAPDRANRPQRRGAELAQPAVAGRLDGCHALEQALQEYMILRRTRRGAWRQSRVAERKPLAWRNERIVVEPRRVIGVQQR